jgi:hypothetical protein
LDSVRSGLWQDDTGLTLRCSNYRLRPCIQMQPRKNKNTGGGGYKSSKMMDTDHILQTVPGVNPPLSVFLHRDRSKTSGEREGGGGIFKAVQRVRYKKLKRNTGCAPNVTVLSVRPHSLIISKTVKNSRNNPCTLASSQCFDQNAMKSECRV